MPKEFNTPDKPWLKRLYGETISPREVILTIVIALFAFGFIDALI